MSVASARRPTRELGRGSWLQDVAAAAVVYEKAVRAGKGLLLDFAG